MLYDRYFLPSDLAKKPDSEPKVRTRAKLAALVAFTKEVAK
jgi:hypothetical protein